jgi:hypothetical protein
MLPGKSDGPPVKIYPEGIKMAIFDGIKEVRHGFKMSVQAGGAREVGVGRNNQIVLSLLSYDVIEAIVGAIFKGHIDQQDVLASNGGLNARDQYNAACSCIRLELVTVRQRIVIGNGQGIKVS